MFVSGVHEEAEEDMIHELFSEYGPIKNLRVPIDKKSGFFKGYALIEYEVYEQAKKAIEGLNGHDLLGKKLTIGWAFKKGSGNS